MWADPETTGRPGTTVGPVRKLALALLAAAALAGCGTGNDKYDACSKQADRIAQTQGADAGSAKLHQCVDSLANGQY